MIHALLFHLLVAIHRTQQVLDVVYKTLTVCEVPQQKGLTAVRALWLALLDPSSEAVLTG
jgi:hypothetical protein